MRTTHSDGMLTTPRPLTPAERARIVWALRDDPPIHEGKRDWERLPLTGPLPTTAKPAPRQPWMTRASRDAA